MRETADFLRRLEEFFLYDDQSRWRAMGWTIAVAGTLGTMDLVVAGSSVDEAVLFMGTIILLMSVGWIGWYCSFRQTRIIERSFLSRRALIFQAASFLAFVFSLRLPRLEAQALERDLEDISDIPNTEDARKVRDILDSSRIAAVRVSQRSIKTAGLKLIKQGPASWQATIALLNYRSFLNIGAAPNLEQLPLIVKGHPYSTFYDVPSSLGPMYATGKSHSPDVPQFRKLSDVDLNVFSETGPSFLKVVGGWARLDGAYLKRVILENVEIQYRDGAMVLEKVFFVNCTFDFQPHASGIELAKAILDSPEVNFSTLPYAKY